MLTAAEVDVASFDHLDADITHHNAHKLKAAIASGGAVPDIGSLPPHMAGAKAMRAEAAEKLAAIAAVHSELAADLKTSANPVERKKYELISP